MKLRWRSLVNLVVVVALGVVAVGWMAVDLVEFGPFSDDPVTVTVALPETGGALPGAEVSYLGVRVGSVEDATVADGGVELTLSVAPDGPVARELRADVRQKTSLGEPYVDLSPVEPGGSTVDRDELAGTHIPADRTSVPPELGDLLRRADRLFGAIDPDDLRVVAGAGAELADREGELRTILEGVGDLGEVLESRRDEYAHLLSSAAGLTTTLRNHRDALDRALAGGADLATVLAEHRQALGDGLSAAARLGSSGSELLAAIEDDIDGLLAGLDASTHTLAVRPTKVHEILIYTPDMVSLIGKTFDDNAAWSSTQGLNIPYFPTYSLPMTGHGLRLDKIYLPEVIRRVEFDFRDSNPSFLLSPEESAALALGERDADDLLAEVLHDLATGCAEDPARRHCPMAD